MATTDRCGQGSRSQTTPKLALPKACRLLPVFCFVTERCRRRNAFLSVFCFVSGDPGLAMQCRGDREY
jgi:hypothetical protein